MSQPNSKSSMYNKKPLSAGVLVEFRSWSEHMHSDSFSQTGENKLANLNVLNKIVQKICHTLQKEGHFCLYGCVFCTSYTISKPQRRENELVSAAVTLWNETIVLSFQLCISESVSLAEVCSRKAALIIYVDGYVRGGGNIYSNFSCQRGLLHNLCVNPAYPRQVCNTKITFSLALSVVNWSECFVRVTFAFTFLLIGLGVEGQGEEEVPRGEVKLEPWRTIASGDPRYVATAASL
jgi:hypothetical protein